MRHKRIWLAGATCLLALLTTQVQALTLIAPPPPGLRIANADLVVVGTVTGFGAKMVKGEMYKGDVRDMQIAIVKVGETILGKEAKEIKVGFFPPMNVQGGGGRPVLIGRVPTVQLKQDEETCLILCKHPAHKDVYVPLAYYDSITKKDNPNFAKYVEEIKKAAKLLAKPTDNLKSKNADERFPTAALLVTRYRDRRQGAQKTEQISADESKLILEALAGADWTQKQAPGFGSQGTPIGVFYSLNLTEKDGWKPPLDNTKVAEVAKKWCKDNAGKYRINRFVSDKKEDKKDEKK